MIQLSSAGKRYGEKLLFDDLDWLVTPQDRVGVVGGNGTGKSTLLKRQWVTVCSDSRAGVGPRRFSMAMDGSKLPEQAPPPTVEGGRR
jgi:ABC-type phosphate/phosphonate transport system ATPase subunit